MKILRLRIQGFRGIQSAQIDFDDHAVLIGPNGCGKSTIIDALALVLGRTRMVRHLTEHDFIGSDPGPATRTRIIATLSGFSSETPDDHDDWFQSGRSVPKWMDEEGREHADPGPNRRLCANLGFCARFDRGELEVVTLCYFHDDDDATDPFDGEVDLHKFPPAFSPRLVSSCCRPGGNGTLSRRSILICFAGPCRMPLAFLPTR